MATCFKLWSLDTITRFKINVGFARLTPGGSPFESRDASSLNGVKSMLGGALGSPS